MFLLHLIRKTQLRGIGPICLLFFSFSLFHAVSAQPADRVIGWYAFLQSTARQFNGSVLFSDSLEKLPPAEKIRVLDELRKKTGADTRWLLQAALFSWRNNTRYQNRDGRDWWQQTLREATRKNDKPTLFAGLYFFGGLYNGDQNFDTCTFYLVKAVEVGREAGYSEKDLSGPRLLASHALYRTRNYRACIEYCLQALPYCDDRDPLKGISACNNLGLSYTKLEKYDSAIWYHRRGAELARRTGIPVWWSIATGNIGDALYAAGREEEALPYWQTDVDSCRYYGEELNALMSEAFISRYRFARGQREAAIQQLRSAFSISRLHSLSNVLNMGKMLADCYQQNGQPDSALWYSRFYNHLNDSLNTVIGRNNISYIRLQLDYENKEQETRLLEKEKNAEVFRRNVLLFSLLALFLIGILLYNRQRLRARLNQQQRALAQAAADSARKELTLLTEVLLEKNEQIEQLNQSLQAQRQVNQDELIHQTLLTDYDWNRFRDLFEQTFPGFLQRMKSAAPGITAAELRLASLIRMNLDTKQMASMQGVSLGSIRVTKTRLRQKLNLPAEQELEDFIRQL